MSRYYTDPSLDPSLYALDADELEFFKAQTGIQDEEALKQHILSVQAKAYELYGYPCIRRFLFTKLKIARNIAYNDVLKLLQTRSDPILLDIGCCFGNDVRKLVSDGWPVENIIASDLQQGFWDYGHELFKSTPETFPIAFIPGDIFDDSLLSPTAPEEPHHALAPLGTLTSLTPLRHRVSAIHASAFFHLFSEEKQLTLAKRLAALLLLEEPGSVIFGQHVAMPTKGTRTEAGISQADYSMFCHSPESWRALWVDEVFGSEEKDVRVGVETAVVPGRGNVVLGSSPMDGGIPEFYVMNWAVRVL